MKYIYIWHFDVADGKERECEAVYGQDGAWVRLFKSDEAYLGTTLLKDFQIPGRYITIDRWENRDSCLAFKKKKCYSISSIGNKA